jgi:ribosomal protein L37E
MKKENFKYTPGWFACDKCGKHVYFVDKNYVYVDDYTIQTRCPHCGFVHLDEEREDA